MGGLRGLFAKRSSLDEAAAQGDLRRLRKLVEKGADVNATSPDPKLCHRPAVHAASAKGHVSTVEALINLGADVDGTDSLGRTALHVAALCRQTEVLKMLLTSGADYSIRDNSGKLPRDLCASEGKDLLLGYALEHGMEFSFYEHGHWIPFDEGASRLLSFELGEGAGFAALSLAAEANYIVDFEERIQINVLSLFVKSVSWRVLPNGNWQRPASPYQGLHPGSQDPRKLAKYSTLLQSLSQKGVPVCPSYFKLSQAVAGLFGARVGHREGSSSTQTAWMASAPPPGVASLSHGVEFQSSTAWPDCFLGPSLSREEYERLVGRPVDSAHLQTLRSVMEEYNDVAARFLSGMDRPALGLAPGTGDESMRSVTILSISRIVLPYDRVEPFFRARAALQARWGVDNVRRGWHGGPKGALEGIIHSGFALQQHGRNGRLYGNGLYLAAEEYARTSAEFAGPDAQGAKHLLLCLVALGSSEPVPFESVQRRPSNVMRYDTGVDNVASPTRYVVWEEDMNDLVLPTHLLAFRYC